MLKDKIIRLLSALASIAMAIWIFLSPIRPPKGNLTKIDLISRGINEILAGIGFSLKLESSQMIQIILIIEYFIFGILLMITTKVYSHKTLKNIFFPLFTGLFTAVLMAHNARRYQGAVYGIESIIMMFEGLVAGIILFLLIELISSKFGAKKSIKKSKYKRGR